MSVPPRPVALVSHSRAADAGYLAMADVAALAQRLGLTSGAGMHMQLALPDVTAAICVKALAYKGRLAAKDAVDLWRLLHAAHAAGVRADKWPTGPTGRAAATVLHSFFGRTNGPGLAQVSARPADRTRMRALVMEVVAAVQTA